MAPHSRKAQASMNISRFTLYLSLIASLTTLTSASSPGKTNAQQPLQPTTTTTNNLSHLSALFLKAASTSTASSPSTQTPNPSPCCSTPCAPQQCNIHLPPTHSILDLAWLYATPSPPPSVSQPSTSIPCCNLAACADGACRPLPAISSQRPPRGAQITSAPEPGPNPGPGFRQPDAGNGVAGDEPAGIGYGCCDGCRLCRHSGRAPPEGGEETMRLRPSASVSASTSKGGSDGGVGDDEVRARQCVGCVGGRCWPCRGEKVVEVLGMQVEDLRRLGQGQGQVSGEGIGVKVVERVRKFVGGTDARKQQNGGSGEDEDLADQPVFLLGHDFVDGVQGVNQDMVAVVVQGFAGREGSVAMVGKGEEFELLTLLATVDLKVQENYLARRIVKALGREGEVRIVEAQQAVLNSNLDVVQVEGSLNMGIVIGSLTGDDKRDQKLLKGVKWNVYDDQGLTNVPDVLLGTKLLNEIGGLRLTDVVRRSAEEGVRAIGVGHSIAPAVDESVKSKFARGKDEL